MSIKYIKHMWTYEKGFFILIILVQAIACFAMLFSGVVLKNNAYTSREDEYETTKVYVTFTEELTYEEIKKACTELSKDGYESVVNEFQLSYKPVSNSEYPIIYMFSVFGLENGHYTVGKFVKEYWGKRVINGRLLSEADMNSGENIAMVSDHIMEKIMIGNKEFSIAGTVATDAYANGEEGNLVIYSSPEALVSFAVQGMEIGLSRMLLESEKENMTGILDEHFAGRYEVAFGSISDKDKEATIKAVNYSQIFVSVCAVATLLLLYIYLFSKREYHVAVWRLVGCSKIHAVAIIFGEIFLVTISSVCAGTGLFVIAAKSFLVKIYKYIPGLVTVDYILKTGGMILVMMVVIGAGLSVRFSGCSIKKLISR